MGPEIVGGHAAEVIVMFEESVLSVRELREGQRFLVGGEGDLPWPLEHATPLVRRTRSGATEIVAAASLAGALQMQLLDGAPGEALHFVDEIDTGAKVATVPRHRHARVQLGEVTLLVGETEAARREVMPPKVDLRVHASTGAAALFFLLALLFLNAIPPGAESLAIDAFELAQRGVRLRIEPPVEPPSAAGGGEQHALAPAPAPARKTLAPRIVAHAGDMKTGTKPMASRDDRKTAAAAAASTAGALGILRQYQGSSTGSIFGASNVLGEAEGAMGEIGGSLTGDAAGTAAIDRMGAHMPGGADTIGLGKIGSGPGKNGYGSCAGCANGLRGHAVEKIDAFAMTQPKIIGDVDRDMIRRAVRSQANAFRFCYERELQHNANLDGRVVTQFTIAPNGKVVASLTKTSTMNDVTVDSCVADVFHRLSLPAMPAGAGPAIVIYPLVFHSAAQGM